MGLSTIDVAAVRLWLDTRVTPQVLAGTGGPRQRRTCRDAGSFLVAAAGGALHAVVRQQEGSGALAAGGREDAVGAGLRTWRL